MKTFDSFKGGDCATAQALEAERGVAQMTEVGATLPNGALVLASRPASGNYNLVLAFAAGSDDRFVTWKIDPETGEAFWGSYYENLLEAVEDYKERT